MLAVVAHRRDQVGPSAAVASVFADGPSEAPRGVSTSIGVLMMDDLWSDPVRDSGFGVQVCSNAQRSWVSLRGELDLVSASHLRQVLAQLCRDGYPKIVVDLSGLEFWVPSGWQCFTRLTISCGPSTAS